MIRFVTLLFTALLSTFVFTRANEIPGKVVVRFAPQSASAIQWKSNNRTGEISVFRSLVGAHSTSGYVSAATLKSISKQQNTKANSLNSTTSPDLSLIAIVHYTSAISPLVLARKLSSHPDVVYAEPLYQESLVGVPNDSLVIDQYYLPLVKAFEAWGLVPENGNIVVGIVDTGIDTAHVDLAGNIWRNSGETGLDGASRDKRFNNIDDDGNGFVDDWFGWDFVGLDGESPDNEPLPGHFHGTHIGGIVAAVRNNLIGISGTAINTVVMPVKVGLDNSGSTTVFKTADAILYAAANGASVINCSFGSPSQSFASSEVIQQATALGALVVGAAGNETVDQAFYPASYPEVLSVTATDWNDRLASFSNIHRTVDVSAPGVGILSTVPGSRYSMFDGTSMAAPVVAGIAALLRLTMPELTPHEVLALIKANTDNIDTNNLNYVGRFGTGRVNAYRTLKNDNSRYAEIADVTAIDENSDGVLSPGEKLQLSFTINNVLDRCPSVSVKMSTALHHFVPTILLDSVYVGEMAHGGIKRNLRFELIVPDTVGYNDELGVLFSVRDSSTEIGRELVVFTVNPSYITMEHNDVHVTVNSKGNLAYNDYPSNTQGRGLAYKSNTSILFEGGLMVGVNSARVSNVIRGANTTLADTSFTPTSVVMETALNGVQGFVATSKFTDRNELFSIGVDIIQRVYQPTADSVRNILLLCYDVTNGTDTTIPNLYVAHFDDWDIGPMGDYNGCAWDHALGNYFVQNTAFTGLPAVGMSMISGYVVNFFTFDNGGNSDSPSIYDNFLRSEKWLSMSEGVARTNSGITDVSAVLGAGPITLNPGEVAQVCFVIALGGDYNQISSSIARGRTLATELGLKVVPFVAAPRDDRIIYIENAPWLVPGATTIKFELRQLSNVIIDIVDLSGRVVGTVLDEPEMKIGVYEREIIIPSLATAIYMIRLRTGASSNVVSVTIGN